MKHVPVISLLKRPRLLRGHQGPLQFSVRLGLAVQLLESLDLRDGWTTDGQNRRCFYGESMS